MEEEKEKHNDGDTEERTRAYALALESDTYAEYFMKLDLRGLRHGRPACDEKEFREAHDCLDEFIRTFPALRTGIKNWLLRRYLARHYARRIHHD